MRSVTSIRPSPAAGAGMLCNTDARDRDAVSRTASARRGHRRRNGAHHRNGLHDARLGVRSPRALYVSRQGAASGGGGHDLDAGTASRFAPPGTESSR